MRIHCVAWRLSASRSLAALLALGCSDDGHRLGGAYELADGLRIGTCASGADIESIDRMEDRDGTIDPIAGRGGVWLTWNDETGTQVPSSKAETFVMTELSPPRAASHFAASSRGEGFSEWGAGIGFELHNQQAYDLSSYAGITFWARRAPGTSFVLRFGLPNPATTPRGGQCKSYDDYSTCNGHFGADLRLTTEFVRYRFSWSELEQPSSFGEPRPDFLDPSAVYAVHFQVDREQDFDFTIDDIALLCHPD